MAARFWVGGAGVWDASDTTHWSATSGGAGGASVPGVADTVTFDANSGGGVVTVNTDFSVISVTMGAFTGTLDFSTNNNSPTMASFSGTGTGARTLNMGNGTWTLTGNNTTIWNFATVTNLTFNSGNSIVNCTYSGSTGTRTITPNTARLNSLKISAGSDTVALSSTWRVTDIDFTGFTGIGSLGAADIAGNLTLGTGMTINTSGSVWTFSATSSKNIISNGVQNNRPYTFDGVGGTWVLKDDLDLGGATPRQVTLNNGTLDVADGGATHNVTFGSFVSSNSNTRTLLMGSGTWTITGTGTVWNTGTITGLTFDSGTSTVVISDTSASEKVLGINSSLLFNNLTLTTGSAGNYRFSLSANLNDLNITGPVTAVFAPNGTYTIRGNFNVVGSSGNLATILSNTAGTPFNLTKSSGVVNTDYLSIKDSNAIGGASWYAGANSVNVSGNRGWQFSPQDISKANFFNVIN